MVPEGSPPCSWETTTQCYCEPDHSSPDPPILFI